MEIKRTEKTERAPRVSEDLKGRKNIYSNSIKRRGVAQRVEEKPGGRNIADEWKRKEKSSMAAALKYDPEIDYAPQISALGKGIIAENILRIAREANIPVYRDEQLVDTLNRLRIGDEIPRELFEVVAEVLVFISRSDERYANAARR